MAIDIEGLVAPLSEEAPSGSDLSYDNERLTIETAFERSVSGDDEASPEIDWRETIGLITDQAQKTRDIWLPVYLMRAAAQAGRFETLVDGAELLARLMEERWADVHPQLDEVGFTGRKTPCESLTRVGEFLNPLQTVPLVEHQRLGRYSGRDFIRFQDEGSGADGYGMFRAAIEATPAEDLRTVVERIDALRGAILRADSVLTANADGDTATNFKPTYEVIDKMRRAFVANLPDGGADIDGGASAGTDTAAESDSGQSTAQGNGQASEQAFSGSIQSRADVARAIDSICAYYRRCEPNSPVPFALLRAKEWINLDFMAVLEDIAPGGFDEAVKVLKGGRTSSAESDGWGDSSSSSDSSDADDGWGNS